jgi:alpha-L-fucosidase
MSGQLNMLASLEAIERMPAQSFGAKGKRAWFWQDGSWQVGRAWEVDELGRVAGMCRDYGPWGCTYAGAMPCESHGRWKAEEVRWKRPADQYEGPSA